MTSPHRGAPDIREKPTFVQWAGLCLAYLFFGLIALLLLRTLEVSVQEVWTWIGWPGRCLLVVLGSSPPLHARSGRKAPRVLCNDRCEPLPPGLDTPTQDLIPFGDAVNLPLLFARGDANIVPGRSRLQQLPWS